MSQRIPYSDVPWLSSELLSSLLDDAYELGESAFRYYPAADGGVDWDAVMNRLESHLPTSVEVDGFSEPCVLPLTYDHSLMARLKKAYRRGYRDGNQ